jgi:hypothetical protein
MKGEIMKIVAPAGRYFVGDVCGLSRPLVAIPARSSVFYSDCGEFEIEIAGGGSSMPDETAFGLFGVIEFSETGATDDDAEYLCVITLSEPTEIEFDFDYLAVGEKLKFSVIRETGLKFTSTDDEIETVLG